MFWGKQHSASSPSRLYCSSLFCECPKFCDLAKHRRKIFGGVSEVGKDDFSLYFFWRCVVFLVLYYSSAAIARLSFSSSPPSCKMRRVKRERQLHLKVRALCGEVEKVFDVLVDKGAQVSLVKAGLLPPECLTDSRKPVRLKVANGQYMVGGTKEAAIGLQFVNHRELSRPDLGKEILLQGRFYEAEMDWDMMVGYHFMMETDSGVLPA